MSTKPYDLVIRGGTVATASATSEADIAISGETIAAIGRGLPDGAAEIDARGKLVLPGGVDSHAHVEQISAAGLLNADTFGDLVCRPARRHAGGDGRRRLSRARP